MKLNTIHHIAIIVSDYERSRDFYVNKLGFSVIRENYRPARDDWKLDLRINETTGIGDLRGKESSEAGYWSGGGRTSSSGFLCRGFGWNDCRTGTNGD